jgi:hypothetical protein
MPGPVVDVERDDALTLAEAVEAAVREAVKDALRQHKRAGNTVVGWRDGQIELIPPEEIPVDEGQPSQ